MDKLLLGKTRSDTPGNEGEDPTSAKTPVYTPPSVLPEGTTTSSSLNVPALTGSAGYPQTLPAQTEPELGVPPGYVPPVVTNSESRKLSDLKSAVTLPRLSAVLWNKKELFWWSFRHPYSRLFTVIVTVFGNIFLYLEDPTSRSFAITRIPVVGPGIVLLFLKWPDDGALVWWKLLIGWLSLLGGILFGRYVVHHKLFRDRLGLAMFRDNQGTWMVQFWTSILSLFIGSRIFNAITWERPINNSLGFTNVRMGQMSAVATWVGDYFTFFVVVDMMLQDRESYPGWAPRARNWWQKAKQGKVRIYLFWGTLLPLTLLFAMLIFYDGILEWERSPRLFFVRSTEVGRVWLAAAITMADLLVVMQDWDFPLFTSSQDLLLPGLSMHDLKLSCIRLPDRFMRATLVRVHISAKWLNYGVVFLIHLLDINMLVTQIAYRPLPYGQYTDPASHIVAITNATLVEELLHSPNKTQLISWETRRGVGDARMHCRWIDVNVAVELLATIPPLAILIIFLLLTKYGASQAIVGKMQPVHAATTGSDPPSPAGGLQLGPLPFQSASAPTSPSAGLPVHAQTRRPITGGILGRGRSHAKGSGGSAPSKSTFRKAPVVTKFSTRKERVEMKTNPLASSLHERHPSGPISPRYSGAYVPPDTSGSHV
eukprot:jgi/Mesvir1/17237/Mv07650-RA.1